MVPMFECRSSKQPNKSGSVPTLGDAMAAETLGLGGSICGGFRGRMKRRGGVGHVWLS